MADNNYWRNYWRIADAANECDKKRRTYPLSSTQAKQLDKLADKIIYMFWEYGYEVGVQTKFSDELFEQDIARYRTSIFSFPDGPLKGSIDVNTLNGLLLISEEEVENLLNSGYSISHDSQYDPVIDGRKILNFDYTYSHTKPAFVERMLEALFLSSSYFYVYTEKNDTVQLNTMQTLQLMKRDFNFSLTDSKYYTMYDGSAP